MVFVLSASNTYSENKNSTYNSICHCFSHISKQVSINTDNISENYAEY